MTDLIVATAGDVSSAGIMLIIPPATTASGKRYKCLATGGSIAAGDMVLCAKIDGTYVVLGKVDAETGDGGGKGGGIPAGGATGQIPVKASDTDFDLKWVNDTNIKPDEIGIVITGARPSTNVSAEQYVIVRNSTISGITDGLYTANAALSPSTDVTAAKLTAVSNGGLNSLQQSKMDKVALTAGTTWNFYSCYGYTDDGKTITLTIPVSAQVNVTTPIVLTKCQGSLRSSSGSVVGGFSFNYLPYVTTSQIYSAGRGINIILNKSDGFGITGMSIICGFISLSFQDDLGN